MEKVNILIVDDVPEKLLALEAVLSNLGETLIKAHSGREALRLLLQHDFAVILLDVNMPGMDGFETAAFIRQRKNSEATPIIFVTAMGATETHQAMGYSLGAVDYIFQPIVPEVLKTKVKVFVELYRLHEELRKKAQYLELRVQERTAELEQANEELKRLSQVKSDFASLVSHELRAPLCVIKEGISLMLGKHTGPITDSQKETLDITNNNVDRLMRLINNVLNLSQMEHGELQSFLEKTDLNKLVADVVNLMKMGADLREVGLDLMVPDQTVTAVCDSDQIRQVLINLIDNAVKFTDKKGKVVVALREDVDFVEMTVEDTGMGIAQEELGKIFEMFGQSSIQRGRRRGTGVGLAVCKKYMELHSGEIVVQSTVGVGSKFSVKFPSNLKI